MKYFWIFIFSNFIIELFWEATEILFEGGVKPSLSDAIIGLGFAAAITFIEMQKDQMRDLMKILDERKKLHKSMTDYFYGQDKPSEVGQVIIDVEPDEINAIE